MSDVRDAAAAADDDDDDNPPSPVRVTVAGPNAFYVWSVRGVRQLRTRHRIVGEFVGCMPAHISQNQFLSLPLALSAYEVALGVCEGFIALECGAFDTAFRRNTGAHLASHAAERSDAARLQWAEADRRAEVKRMQMMAEEELRLRRRKKKEQRQQREQQREDQWPARGEKRSGPATGAASASSSSSSAAAVARDGAGAKRKAPSKGGGREDAGARTAVASDAEASAPEKRQRTRLSGSYLWRAASGYIGALVSRGVSFVTRGLMRARVPSQPASRASASAAAATAAVAPQPGRETPSRNYTIKVATERTPHEHVAAASAARITDLEAHPAWRAVLRSRKYLVFRDLWRRGFFLSNGQKFGADFLAYAHDPSLVHAGICVVVKEKHDAMTARDIVSLGRLGVATKKHATIAFVERGEAVRYQSIHWVESLP